MPNNFMSIKGRSPGDKKGITKALEGWITQTVKVIKGPIENLIQGEPCLENNPGELIFVELGNNTSISKVDTNACNIAQLVLWSRVSKACQLSILKSLDC